MFLPLSILVVLGNTTFIHTQDFIWMDLELETLCRMLINNDIIVYQVPQTEVGTARYAVMQAQLPATLLSHLHLDSYTALFIFLTACPLQVNHLFEIDFINMHQ